MFDIDEKSRHYFKVKMQGTEVVRVFFGGYG